MSRKRLFPKACDEFFGSTAPSRQAVGRLVDRAQALAEPDRALVNAIYLNGRPLAEVARLRCQPVRVVRRRLWNILARVHSPGFIFVLRCRHRWPMTNRRVATAIFIHGLTIKQASAELNLTYSATRRHYDAIRALIGAAAPADEQHAPSNNSITGVAA